MKLSRNVLVGSLATVGMVLGAVAPAVTAQAATTSGKFVDGKLTQVQDENVNGLGSENAGLAIAYDAGDGSTVGSATATSNANVNVVSGILTLDAVPDFGFGTAAAGTTVNLKNNNASSTSTAEDSQNQGLLSVTESRAGAPGFTLGAVLGQFTSGTESANDFELTLAPTALLDDEGNNVSTGADLKTDEATLKSDGKTSGQIMNLTAGKYNTGAINASFTAADKNAKLKVSGSATGAKEASSKSYDSTITWTLTAKPSTDSTGSTESNG